MTEKNSSSKIHRAVKPSDVTKTHKTFASVNKPSVIQKRNSHGSSPQGVCDGQHREALAPEKADECGGRADPCVFVLGNESMLVGQATDPVTMTQPLKYGPLRSVESHLCGSMCRS